MNDIYTVIIATGVTWRQILYWREKGWLHSLTNVPRPYRWDREIRQIDWLARLSVTRELDDLDAEGGYILRIQGAQHAIRFERDPWQAATVDDITRALKAGRIFSAAQVPSPHLASLKETA